MVIYYTRFVNDIFIIYNKNSVTPLIILENFNKEHLKFTISEENNNQIA
jgi:hypothetical protein